MLLFAVWNTRNCRSIQDMLRQETYRILYRGTLEEADAVCRSMADGSLRALLREHFQ